VCAAGDVVEPLAVQAVLLQCLVLEADAFAFLLVAGEPVAAGAAERVAGELGEPVELLLRPAPVIARALGAVRLARDVVARCAASEREASVAAARSFGNAARVMNADAQPALGEPQRGRATGDARADDGDVDPAVVPGVGAGWCGIFEPVRIQDVLR
jgi:hypothetical protein